MPFTKSNEAGGPIATFGEFRQGGEFLLAADTGVAGIKLHNGAYKRRNDNAIVEVTDSTFQVIDVPDDRVDIHYRE